MSILPDPITDVIGLFLQHALESKLWKRVELLLEMGIAFSIAFLAACGTALLASRPVAWSIGAGMVASAIAILATFGASPNSKGLVIAFPQQAAEAKLDTPMTTIERK